MLRLFYLLVIVTQVFPQRFEVTQITNFDMDCRNPSLLSLGNLLAPYTYVYFEGHQDTIVNIYYMKYDVSSNIFYDLKNVSNNSQRNINPVAQRAEYDYPLVFFQTNKRGNWDIEFALAGDTVSHPFLNSEDDETNFKLVSYSLEPLKFSAIYNKKDDVHLLIDSNETLIDQKFFESTDTLKFLEATGSIFFSANQPVGFIAAIGKKPNENPKVYYKYRSSTDNLWSDTKIAYDSGSCERIFAFQNYLVVESRINNKLNIFRFNSVSDFGINSLAEPVNPKEDFESFGFRGVDINSLNPCFSNPHIINSYQLKRNDSIFIHASTNINNFTLRDTMIYTSVVNRAVEIKPMFLGLFNEIISYTIWEDSSNGKVNLFGLKREDFITDLREEQEPINSFLLSQNYPNPFNPTTTINFTIPRSTDYQSVQKVTLKIYDVLGREVATLVNAELSAGEYEVEFTSNSASNFRQAQDGASSASTSSAFATTKIYFYQLRVGSYVETKKMILLR